MQTYAESAQLEGALGRVLRERREESGRSLRAVAEQAGISATHLSEVERGVKEISLGRLGGLAEALEVPVGEIFLDIAIALGAAPARPRRPLGFSPNPRDEIEWVLGRLPDDELRSMAAFGSFLAAQRVRNETTTATGGERKPSNSVSASLVATGSNDDLPGAERRRFAAANREVVSLRAQIKGETPQ